MVDLNAALVQQFMPVSITQRKGVVQPPGVLDDGHGEPMAARLGVGHGGSASPDPVQATQPIQIIRAAHCNTLSDQFHRPTRQQERRRIGFKNPSRAQEVLDLHARGSDL